MLLVKDLIEKHLIFLGIDLMLYNNNDILYTRYNEVPTEWKERNVISFTMKVDNKNYYYEIKCGD